LAVFNGLNPNGVWTLQLYDNATGDTGTLNGWTLTLMNSEPWTTTDVFGLYTFNGLATGKYTVRHVVPAGWNAGPGPVDGGHAITIGGAGPQALDRDFGELRANAIYGRFYDDVNHSGSMSPGEASLAGWTAFLDRNNNGTPDTVQKATASTNVPLPLPDLKTTNSTISVSGSLGPIIDVNVNLSITHTNVQHLDVYLVSPSGTKVELFTDVGGSGDNFINTTLDDQAAISITAGSAPFTGTYRPEGQLADFNGQSADGIWTLQVYDDTSGTTGTLTAWSVIITTAEPTAVSDSDGSYVLTDVPAGAQTVRRVLQSGYTATQPSSGSYAVTMTSDDTIIGRDFGQTQAPLPPKVTAVTIDDGTGQRSQVRSVTLTLSAAIPQWPTNKADAFALRRLHDNAPVTLQVAESGNIVTLTFTGGAVDGLSLADGRYGLTIFADQLGGRFDGNGDGQGGDDFQLFSDPAPDSASNIFRFFGDSNGDGAITAADFAVFRLDYGSSGASIFDFNFDGQVTAFDFNEFRLRYGAEV
jgi:subtilisin-like proprotein convertase family protein